MPSEVDASVWRAAVGSSVEIPPLHSNVYYFPDGHLERTKSSLNYNFTLSRPFIPCQLLSVRFLSDLSSDELFVKMILRPRPCDNDNNDGESKIKNDVVSFSKSLTPSDAHNGGGFLIPKFCGEMIFPRLESIAGPGDVPAQDLTVTDAARNHAWEFRHIYRGTPPPPHSQHRMEPVPQIQAPHHRRVFMKKKSTGELFVGVRRRAHGGRTRREGENDEALEAVRRAEAGAEFEVVYYPEFGWPDFVVRAEKVEDALKVRWTAGMRVRMAVDGDDFSRLSWFQGVVEALLHSPWRMLQVNWDEPEVLQRRVCPWQVEHIPLIEPHLLPPSKKLKAHNTAAALLSLPESIHPHHPNTSLTYNISSSTLFLGGGLQGVRQDDNNQQPGSSAVVSTILSIGSSWYESEDVHARRTGHIGSGGCSMTFRLFGKMIHMPGSR